MSRANSKPSSKLFFNSGDVKQFENIYNTMFKCHDINFIPTDIIYQISEYATGIVKKCENYEKCKQEIAILKENKLEYYPNGDYYYLRKKYLKQQENQIYDILQNKGNHIKLFCADCALDIITKNLDQLNTENVDNLDILVPAHRHMSYLLIEKEDNNEKIWQLALNILNKCA